jgi:hypothetical protein
VIFKIEGNCNRYAGREELSSDIPSVEFMGDEMLWIKVSWEGFVLLRYCSVRKDNESMTEIYWNSPPGGNSIAVK